MLDLILSPSVRAILWLTQWNLGDCFTEALLHRWILCVLCLLYLCGDCATLLWDQRSGRQTRVPTTVILRTDWTDRETPESKSWLSMSIVSRRLCKWKGTFALRHLQSLTWGRIPHAIQTCYRGARAPMKTSVDKAWKAYIAVMIHYSQ